jgi:signal transduction histidine kinase
MLKVIALAILVLYISFVSLVFFARRGRITLSNVYFSLLMAASSVWVIGVYYFASVETPNELLLAARLAWLPAPVLAVSLYVFAAQYTKELAYKLNKFKPGSELMLIFLASCLGVVAVSTDLVVANIDPRIRKIQFGPIYYLLLFFIFLWVFLSAHRVLTAKTTSTTDNAQLKVISIGIVSTATLALISNLIVPIIVGNSSYSFLGIFTTIPLNVAITYAILRHRFLDIRLLLGRIIYYVLVASLPFAIFFFLVRLYEDIFTTVFHPVVYAISVPVSIAFVILFNSINSYIRAQVTTRLINPGYDPLITGEKYTTDLSLVLDMEQIAQVMDSVIKRTVRPDFSAIVLFPDVENKNDAVIFAPDRNKLAIEENLFRLQQIFALIWSTVGKYPFVTDEIEYEREAGIYRNTPNLATEGLAVMQKLGVKIAIPISAGNAIRGIYLIGQKEADAPYSSQDVDFLKSIAISTSVAIERSLLYSEVQEFADTLQQKVDLATQELKKANTDLAVAFQEVQEARRKERDMIDVMGHELRTPISIVRNALAMLHREQEKGGGHIPNDKLAEYLGMAIESAKREITLIETLLSATKVDASRLQLTLTKVALSDVIRDGIEGQRHLLADKQLELAYTPPATDVFVYADRTRIQEIMDNFLSNAVKYTPKGSITIATWADTDFGYISIADTGMGIDAADIQNLGKKFFRAKQYVSGLQDGKGTKVVRPGGTGLGLYVAFELVRVMGGRLYINSKVGQGTTFTFAMPLFKSQADKQYDQTFDAGQVAERNHIVINGPIPRP